MSTETPLNINNYYFERPLTNENSGFSMWGIGTRGGKTYFVKAFLSPVFPVDENGVDDPTKAGEIQRCMRFQEKKQRLYQAIHNASDGNLVEIQQFFRAGAKYYISTKAIREKKLTIAQIAGLQPRQRLQLCCSLAHSFAGLHAQGVVHADVKPDNILITGGKNPRARIIDFDAGFLESEPPSMDEELNGDLVYLSPEAFLHIAEIESRLTCKMDIFALGILFHEYLTGERPAIDTYKYDSIYEAALDHGAIVINGGLDGQIRSLLADMLKADPDERPNASRVFSTLHQVFNRLYFRDLSIPQNYLDDSGPFKIAGDL